MKKSRKKEIYLRKLTALFPDEKNRNTAMAILNAYGVEEYEREPDRVRLAILKISGNDLKQIRRNTALAKQDFRDTLVEAEYPNQGKSWRVPNEVEKQKLIAKDRLQYEKWLHDE